MKILWGQALVRDRKGQISMTFFGEFLIRIHMLLPW